MVEMKLSKIIERERIGIKKLLVPSNSGLSGASPDPFRALGITMQDAEIYFDRTLGVEVLQKRGEDIPGLCDFFTAEDIPVFGITGDDLFDEYKLRVPSTKLRLIDTEDWIVSPQRGGLQMYSRPTLAFIGLEGTLMGNIPKKARVVVNAKYACTAREWLADVSDEYGVEFMVRELNGKTETEIPERADFVIDIVFSGNTLRYVDADRKIERTPRLGVVQPIRQSDISMITSWSSAGERYLSALQAQYERIEERLRRPTGSLTAQLLQDSNLLVKKLGEESAELVAAVAKKDRVNFLEELQQSSGWLPMVAAVSLGVPFDKYMAALANRGK